MRFRANLERAGVWSRVRHVRCSPRRAPSTRWPATSICCTSTELIGTGRRGRTSSCWGERVRPGGDMLIHDSFNAIGVTLAQLRLLFVSDVWRYHGRAAVAGGIPDALLARRRSLAQTRCVSSGVSPTSCATSSVKVLIVARLGRWRPSSRLWEDLAVLSSASSSEASGPASGTVVDGHVRRSLGKRSTGTSHSASIAIRQRDLAVADGAVAEHDRHLRHVEAGAQCAIGELDVEHVALRAQRREARRPPAPRALDAAKAAGQVTHVDAQDRSRIQ